jgi:hypothetical protein
LEVEITNPKFKFVLEENEIFEALRLYLVTKGQAVPKEAINLTFSAGGGRKLTGVFMFELPLTTSKEEDDCPF